jgi:nucleoside permease NupC
MASSFLLAPWRWASASACGPGTSSVGFILAMQALPAVVVFASLMAGLYYLGVMQAIVGLFASRVRSG